MKLEIPFHFLKIKKVFEDLSMGVRRLEMHIEKATIVVSTERGRE